MIPDTSVVQGAYGLIVSALPGSVTMEWHSIAVSPGHRYLLAYWSAGAANSPFRCILRRTRRALIES